MQATRPLLQLLSVVYRLLGSFYRLLLTFFVHILVGYNSLTYIRAALSELTEIDKARAVSERAVKTINFREEQEKFNVWVARLNLENLYGSRETLMSKFEEACKLNDVKKMHLQLLSIFEKNNEAQITEQFFKSLSRKFRASCKVWLRYCQFKLGGQHAEAAQRVLDRRLQHRVVRAPGSEAHDRHAGAREKRHGRRLRRHVKQATSAPRDGRWE